MRSSYVWESGSTEMALPGGPPWIYEKKKKKKEKNNKRRIKRDEGNE